MARSLQGASSQAVWAVHGRAALVTGTPTAPREAAWCKTMIMKTTWASYTAARKTVPTSTRAALQAKKRLDNLRPHRGTASLSVATIAQKTVCVTQSRQSKYYLRLLRHASLCDSWRIKDQLHVTCYFISLLMCSTCFGAVGLEWYSCCRLKLQLATQIPLQPNHTETPTHIEPRTIRPMW